MGIILKGCSSTQIFPRTQGGSPGQATDEDCCSLRCIQKPTDSSLV